MQTARNGFEFFTVLKDCHLVEISHIVQNNVFKLVFEESEKEETLKRGKVLIKKTSRERFPKIQSSCLVFHTHKLTNICAFLFIACLVKVPRGLQPVVPLTTGGSLQWTKLA